MNEEQKPEMSELLAKQLRVQKRIFVTLLVQTVMLTIMVGMWLFLFMYSA